MKPRILSYALITIGLWASMASIIKALTASVPNLETLAVSSVWAFVFLLIINAASGRLALLRSLHWMDYLCMAGLGFVGLFLYSAFYYYGISVLTSQEACILNYLWPVLLVLFSCLLDREKMTLRKMAALLISFLGVLVLSVGGFSLSADRGKGIAACVTAAACYALYCVLNKKADYDQNITQMVIWAVVAVCSFSAAGFTGQLVSLQGASFAGMIYLGVLVDGAAYLLWALALSGSESTAGVANLAFLTPVISVFISAFALGESLSLRTLFALCLIMGGVLLQNLPVGMQHS